MEYNFRDIEKKWREYWIANKVYQVEINEKPKYYVLDMFPYPSGAGLHVGHPLGYIASDIYSRYKRLQGFNVLHPMGYDAYGLPAEQYAIQTGQHPAITTVNNINRYREQLDKIGLVVFFFGLGFFYRIYEERLKPYLNGSLKNALGLSLLYFGSYAVDVLFWHSTLNVFGVHTYHHFPLYILHALLGISMMICLCKLLPAHKLKWICFMGINSLVFYYLNGGVIKVLRALYNAIGIHLTPAFGYFEILFMAISASFVIAGIVLLIKRYIPIIIGDKTAFNALAKRLGLRIWF